MNRMSTLTLGLLAAAALVGAGFYAGHQGSAASQALTSASPAASAAASPAASTAPTTSAASAAGQRRVLYWHDPMVPAQRFEKPGKSPFMDMQLVPVYADEAGDASGAGVKISPTVQQNLGIRTVTVKRTDASSSFDTIGTVQFDERLNVAVQTRVAGYVEHLAVRAPMERVSKGQALATFFAPEWLGPQNELLALKRAGVSEELITAARERMRAMSIPDALVRQSEAAGTALARFTISAPVSGVIAELGVREGVAAAPGTTLFRIAGLEKVWAVAEIPEVQAVRLARGQRVSATLQADATQTFEGALQEILPQVNASTRTLQARFEVDNRRGKLMPGMLLRLQVAGPSSGRLTLPAEAVIRTGLRTVVIVRRQDGSFEPREIQVGAEGGDSIEVLQGLREGEQVVASGQFLIDSEARLKSVLGAMEPAPAKEAK